jgi:2-isopropylmalate synthase
MQTIYRLLRYTVSSGKSDGERVTATAGVSITRGAETFTGEAVGIGPVDAAFNAISKALGRNFELKEFQITAITEGADASGEANIKLHSDAETFSGSGRSSDIIGASILAYLSAVNKIILKEAER